MHPQQLLSLFPFLTWHHLIQDVDRDVWIFREEFRNGRYAKYTLSGTIYGHPPGGSARLLAELQCGRETDRVAVYLEDVTVAKPNRHLGTWMLNRLLTLLKTAARTVPVSQVFGEFSAVDEVDPERRARRDRFFRRFGFELAELSGRRLVAAPLAELRTVPCADLVELEIETVLREWAINRISRPSTS
jgi:hypothetical protein